MQDEHLERKCASASAPVSHRNIRYVAVASGNDRRGGWRSVEIAIYIAGMMHEDAEGSSSELRRHQGVLAERADKESQILLKSLRRKQLVKRWRRYGA